MPIQLKFGRANKKKKNKFETVCGGKKNKRGGFSLKQPPGRNVQKFSCHDLKPFVYKLVKNCVKMSEMRLVKWSPTFNSQKVRNTSWLAQENRRQPGRGEGRGEENKNLKALYGICQWMAMRLAWLLFTMQYMKTRKKKKKKKKNLPFSSTS